MEEKLIRLVKNSPILFDKSHPQYKRLDLKEEVWVKIANEMKLTADEVKRRWRNLRDCFFRARRALCTSGSEVKSPKAKWKHFDLMLFLIDVTAVNTSSSSRASSATSSISWTSTHVKVADEMGFPGKKPNRPTSGKKRRNIKNDAFFEKTSLEMRDLLKAAKDSFRPKDPVTAFFSSMALLVAANNLSFERFSTLQLKVMNAVHNEIKIQKEEEEKT